MGTKTRLANKTQWAILDTIAHCTTARATWKKAMKMARRNLDPAMAILLADLRDEIAQIEKIQRAALNGEYYQEGTYTDDEADEKGGE